jgi:hypothetical protein
MRQSLVANWDADERCLRTRIKPLGSVCRGIEHPRVAQREVLGHAGCSMPWPVFICVLKSFGLWNSPFSTLPPESYRLRATHGGRKESA